MKKLYLFVAGVCLLGMLAPTATFAGKGNKGERKAKPTVASDVYAKYDKDCNGALEATEKDAMRADFGKDKEGPLKAFDTSGDGKLSEEEINAIPATKPGDTPKKERRKKKNQ